ncbi:MAG: DUF1127 domain-containing protein [Burkholderiaceae bacterium]
MSQEAFTPAPDYTGGTPQPPQPKRSLQADSVTAPDDAAPSRTWMTRIVAALLSLKNRTRERKDLQYLLEEAPPHLLNDVGLTRDQIEQELDRLGKDPFWYR